MLTPFKNARDALFKANQVSSALSNEIAVLPTVLFILTIFLYVVFLLFMQPGWVLGGEMWAEMAINYFHYANSPSWLEKLFATDAGYIPVPQRLIALIGSLFNLSASIIPYFYTWSAIVLTGAMVGAFCLKPFRSVVGNDWLRFLTALAVLLVADFESRTFINFTYFAAFYIAIFTALALVDDEQELPWWAWIIPLLMVTKPAVLATLPVVIAVSVIAKPRFRRITLVALVLCIGQIVQMVISQRSGVMPLSSANSSGILSKALISMHYFLGLLGGYLVSPDIHLNFTYHKLTGVFFLFTGGLVIYKFRGPASSLIIVGFSLLFFNVLLNCVALSDSWNGDMIQLANLRVYRHIIIGFFGCVLVLVGALASVLTKSMSPKAGYVLTLLFIVWFVKSGWLSAGFSMSKEPEFPLLKSSQWQNNAAAIDAKLSTLCVPINPLGWMYSRNCGVYSPGLEKGFKFAPIQSINNEIEFAGAPLALAFQNTLVSLAIVVRPVAAGSASPVYVEAIAHLTDGRVMRYAGSREMSRSGALIQLFGEETIPIKQISSIKFVFNSPVEIAYTANEQLPEPGILWMGN